MIDIFGEVKVLETTNTLQDIAVYIMGVILVLVMIAILVFCAKGEEGGD